MADERPGCVANWREIEGPDDNRYEGDDELMGVWARFGRRFGMTAFGAHHERLPPGRRTSYPHAESAEEEFVYVIEGEPDLWLDGTLHRLGPGDAVGFPAGTGVAHCLLNNTDREVRLLVVGENARAPNRCYYPRNPERRADAEAWWAEAPPRPDGGHDGLTDRRRADLAGQGGTSPLG